MKHIRILFMLLMVLIPFMSVVPYAAQKNLYEGFIVSVQVPTGHYLSLHKASKKMKEQLQNDAIKTFPLPDARHLMTLINFDVSINPCLMKKKKKALALFLEQAARQATFYAITRLLRNLQKPLRKEGIILAFQEIHIFEEYVIALFESTALYEKLMSTIENYLRYYLQPYVQDGSIASIRRKAGIEQPYIVLATTKQRKVTSGAAYVPRENVKPFHITKPLSCATAVSKDL